LSHQKEELKIPVHKKMCMDAQFFVHGAADAYRFYFTPSFRPLPEAADGGAVSGQSP